MAMHRRVTLPNLSGTVPFVHGRAHNSLEQDRQDFERNQVKIRIASFPHSSRIKCDNQYFPPSLWVSKCSSFSIDFQF